MSITHEKWSTKILIRDKITFGDEDTDGLIFLHHDALVIILKVLNADVKCIFIDPRCSINVSQLRVVEIYLMKKIVPKVPLLFGIQQL